MKKEEYIKKYGKAAYERMLQRSRKWREAHREEQNVRCRTWREENPEKIEASRHEQNRKGGRNYEYALKHDRIGLRHARNTIRRKHARQYRPYKDIIAPDSQIHHEWIPMVANYSGIALVEANAHQNGIIDVIIVLDGEITLFREEQIKNRNKK